MQKIQKIPHIHTKTIRANKFSKVAVNKASTQKLVAFIYTTNEQSEKEIMKIPFILASERIQYLGINQVKDLYNKNYKTLLEEIKGEG